MMCEVGRIFIEHLCTLNVCPHCTSVVYVVSKYVRQLKSHVPCPPYGLLLVAFMPHTLKPVLLQFVSSFESPKFNQKLHIIFTFFIYKCVYILLFYFYFPMKRWNVTLMLIRFFILTRVHSDDDGLLSCCWVDVKVVIQLQYVVGWTGVCGCCVICFVFVAVVTSKK